MLIFMVLTSYPNSVIANITAVFICSGFADDTGGPIFISGRVEMIVSCESVFVNQAIPSFYDAFAALGLKTEDRLTFIQVDDAGIVEFMAVQDGPFFKKRIVRQAPLDRIAMTLRFLFHASR